MLYDRTEGIRSRLLLLLVALSGLAASLLAQTASDGSLEVNQKACKVTFGYRGDASPYSCRDDAGNPGGYSVTLCQKIAEQIKAELKLPNLTVEWVTLAADGRFQAVREGKVDLLCE